jgi:hypothetical protein
MEQRIGQRSALFLLQQPQNHSREGGKFVGGALLAWS